MEISDWDIVLSGIKDGEIDTFSAAMHASSSQECADSFAQYVASKMGIEDTKIHRTTIVQYAPVFLQAMLKDRSFKDALLNYEYPNGLPNLTKDRTDDFDIRDDGLWHKTYLELVELPLSIKHQNDTFRLSTQFIVINEKQILKMD